MINLEIDLNDEKQLRATKAFIDTLLGAEVPKVASQPEQTQKVEQTNSNSPIADTDKNTAKPPKEKTAKPAKQDQQPVETPTADPAEPETEATQEARELTMDDVRAKVSLLVSKHKAAMQGKLKEIGVKRVADLQEHQYEEFYQFMEGLEND